MTMVSVLHKELESSTRSFRSYSRGSESNAIFQLVNKSSQISPNEVLQSWLINIGYQLLVKNKCGRGGGGLIERGGLLTFFPLKGEGLFERGRGELNRGFTVRQCGPVSM